MDRPFRAFSAYNHLRFEKALAVGIAIFLATQAGISHAAEMTYTWKVISPNTGGVVYNSQAQAEADLHSYTGGSSFTGWSVLMQRDLKNYGSSGPNYVYSAAPQPYEIGPWNNYLFNGPGGWHTGSSEQEVWDEA